MRAFTYSEPLDPLTHLRPSADQVYLIVIEAYEFMTEDNKIGSGCEIFRIKIKCGVKTGERKIHVFGGLFFPGNEISRRVGSQMWSS